MKKRQVFPSSEYPLSDEICEFMDTHQGFFESLKLAKKKRFKLLPVIGITHTPEGHPKSADEIIGMFYCDVDNLRGNVAPFFKQDYVVNVCGSNREFISYSATQADGDYVRPLTEFFETYGSDGKFYHRQGAKPWEHHYNVADDLPDYPGLRQVGKDMLFLCRKSA